MAVRPLFNGAARVGADNAAADNALLNRYVFRAQVGAAPNTATEDIANRPFEVEAGTSYTIHYDIRKFGAGLSQSAPEDALIRIFPDDDSNDARTGAVAEFDVMAAGAALPIVGSVTFTPTTAGTFRIQLELQRGIGAFVPTNTDWRAISDGFFALGGTSAITRSFYADKGRLRSGTRLVAIAVTERGAVAPATFAHTGTEAVRINSTTANAANKTSATETFRIRHRRADTAAVVLDDVASVISSTVQRTERVVNNAFPAASLSYDTVVAVTSASALHTANTRQYDALGGQAASGVWVHLLGVGAGLTLVDYATAERSGSHVVDPRVSLPHRFQNNESTWAGTEVPAGSRHGGQLGFLGVTTLNARLEGVNGASVTDKLWDTAELVGDETNPVKTATNTTRTVLAQAGRTATAAGDKLPIAWDNALPRGPWTAKATLNGATVTGLERDNTRALSLTAESDRFDPAAFALSGVISYK